MSRKIVCAVSSFTAAQKERIREAAERLGFVCEFYGSAKAALEAVGDAEIILGDTPILTQAAPKLRWIFTPSAGINQFGAPSRIAGAFGGKAAYLAAVKALEAQIYRVGA